MSVPLSHWRPASLLIGWLAIGCGIAMAQEKPKTEKKTTASATPEKLLIVRDVHVGFVAKGVMNDRTAFRSTLPAVVLSQRPVPPKPTDAIPQPVGVITVEGAPVENIDVMLEYDNSARMLARWPHTDMRSTRSLWRKLNLMQSQAAPSTAFPANCWLNPLRNANRLTLEQETRLEKFILYDITLRSPNNVELEAADTGYKARNIGASAIHDVTVYRPVGKGKYRAAYLKEFPGQGKSAAPPAAAPAAEGVPKDGTAPARAIEELKVKAQAAVQLNAKAQAIQVESAEVDPLAPAAAPPAEGTTPAVPATPANSPQLNIDWTGAEQTPAELVALWEPLLAAQGLSGPEIAHAQSILLAHAFDKSSARVVFRLDPSVIETLAPLEVTPQPDKLVRVWLMILDGADPEIKTRIAQIITELGDPSYEKRMAAKAQLLKLGPVAVPTLNGEKANKDPEIAFRIEEILEEVQNPTNQGKESQADEVQADIEFFDQ